MATVKNTFDRENCGQWLAVVDGRFLPLISVQITFQRSADIGARSTLRTTGCVTPESDEILVEFETRRDPLIRVGNGFLDNLVTLVNREKKITLHNPPISLEELQQHESVWSIEIKAASYTIEEKSR